MECTACGHANPPGRNFCGKCGAALPAATPSPPAAHGKERGTDPHDGLGALMATIANEPTGLAAGAVVLVLCAAISWVGWTPLSLLPRLIGSVIPEGTCTGQVPGTLPMYVCSAKVAALTVLGPLLFVALLFVLRIPLKKGVSALTEKMPEDSRFFIAPVFATLVFAAAWAGVHYALAAQRGIVSQRMFPVLVGLFTYGVARYGPYIQKGLAPLFAFRDRFPKLLRLVAAVLIPIVFSLVITFQDRVSQEAMKEQLIVVVALVSGFLMLAPRSGDLASGIRQSLSRSSEQR